MAIIYNTILYDNNIMSLIYVNNICIYYCLGPTPYWFNYNCDSEVYNVNFFLLFVQFTAFWEILMCKQCENNCSHTGLLVVSCAYEFLVKLAKIPSSVYVGLSRVWDCAFLIGIMKCWCCWFKSKIFKEVSKKYFKLLKFSVLRNLFKFTLK